MRALNVCAFVAATVAASSLVQAAAVTGSWSGPLANLTAVDLPALGTTDWAFPYFKKSDNTVQTFSKTGATAIQSVAFTSVVSGNRDNTGRDNYGSNRNYTVASFGAAGTYDTNGNAPVIVGNSSGDFQSPWAIDTVAGTSFSYMVGHGKGWWEENSTPRTNVTFTTTIALPAGTSTVRIYLGNSHAWNNVSNVFDNGQTGVAQDNKGYTFSAALSGASTYSSTDWFTQQRVDSLVTMTAGEVGYMELTATPDNDGDLLTMTYNNTSDGRRDLFMQGVTVSTAPIPEPATIGLILAGAAGLLRRRSR